MPISPGVEWEMRVDSEDFSEEFIQGYGGEVREVSHIMELNEHSYWVEDVERPPDNSETEMDESDDECLEEKRPPDANPSLDVIRLGVFDQVFLEFSVLRSDLGFGLWHISLLWIYLITST